MVTYHRIKSVAIISALALAMLALLSGPAHAIPDSVTLSSPGGAIPAAYNSGDAVFIEGTIMAEAGDVIDFSVTIGTATLSFDGITIGLGGTGDFSGSLTLAADEPDGLKDVRIVAAMASDPGVALRVTKTGLLIVDNTAPEFIGLCMSWDPTRELSAPIRLFTNTASPTVTVTVQDPAASGVLPAGFYTPAAISMSVFRENDGGVLGGLVPGAAGAVLRPADRSEPWQIVWTPDGALADGSYFVSASVTDAAGNAASTTEYSFYVDTTPPRIGSEAQVEGVAHNATNGNWFTRNRNVTASWVASADPPAPDLSAGSRLLGYSFQVWTKAGDTPSPEGAMLYNGYSDVDPWEGALGYVAPTGTVTEGWTANQPMPFRSGESYGVWLRAWDMLHNASDWFDPPFVFDPDPPTVPSAPDVTGLVDSAADRRIADSTPSLTWIHSTDFGPVAQSGVGLYEVQVTRAGTPLWDVLEATIDLPDEDVDGVGGDDAPFAGAFSWTVPNPLADGEYLVRVRAKDVAGNYSGWAIVPAFEIDTTPPPVPGMPSTDSPTGNQNPVWVWTGGDSGGGGGDHDEGAVAGYGVYEDGISMGTVPAPSFTSTGLSEGVHVLEVTAIDDLGNESSRSTAGHVLVDLTAPAIPVMAALAPYTNATALALSWTAVGGAVSYELDATIDGATTAMAGIQVPVLLLDIGAATDSSVVAAVVRAVDGVGNTSEWSSQVATIVDRTAASVTISSPASPTDDARPMWSWTGTDALSGVDFYLVALDSEPSFETRDSVYEPASDLSDGAHTLRVKVVDVAGNVSDWFFSDAVVVDTTPPAAPGIPRPKETPTNDVRPGWSWSASPDAVGYNVYLDDGFIASVTVTEFAPADYLLFGVAPLAEGIHHLQVTAVDGVGNESDMSGTGHVTIDLTPPKVPVLAPLPPFTNAESVMLAWTAVDGAVSYDLEGIADALDVPVYLLDISAATDGDIVSAGVRACDSVGNVSAWSKQVSTTVDRTGPVTTVVAAPPDCTNDTRPTWEWIGDDAGLSGVACYIVDLDDEAAFSTTDTSFTPAADLPAGGHILSVVAVDALGNVGQPLVFPAVVIVEPVVVDVNPLPGAYPVNHVSTIVITLTGMVDADLEVAAGAVWLEDWRVVEISRTLASSKFYVLLDETVLVPGRLVLTVNAGMTQDKFTYDVLNERSGFGFGRLRPW